MLLRAFVTASVSLALCMPNGRIMANEQAKVKSVRKPMNDEYLVGVYYFAGWWRPLPNKWHTNDRDWRPDYPERKPLLGEYNEQVSMDKEIAAAAKYGVEFFQIVWYPPVPGHGSKGHLERLNEGLCQFLFSPNSKRMRFTIEFVNHPPFAITTDEGWELACREWCAAMTHPSYLRVDGRSVFKIHSAHHFLEQNGGDEAAVQKRLDRFRRIAREYDLPDPIIGCGAVGNSDVNRYDFHSTYMEIPELPLRDELYPYEELLKDAKDRWKRYSAMSAKPYVPFLPAGWDPRPWKDPRPSFSMPTKVQWTNALQSVKTALDDDPRLGIKTDAGRQKIFVIYAWNEFGEGGIVAPTKGEKYMKLQAIKAVFGDD